MKTFTISSILLAAAASGAVIPRDETSDRSFGVKGYYASCTPHSLFCQMEFNVSTTAGGATTQCSFYGAGPDNIPYIPLTGCKDSNVSFKFTPAGDNPKYQLDVVTADSAKKNTTGTYMMPPDDFAIRDGGSVQTQYYTGPQKFQISDLATKAV